MSIDDATTTPSPEPASKRSSLAVASLVFSLLCPALGSVLAIIFGGMALSRIKKADPPLHGRGMAIAGVIIGVLGLCFWVVALPVVKVWQDGATLTVSSLEAVESGLFENAANGEVAFGNHPDAIAFASDVSAKVDAFVAGMEEKASGFSMTGDQTIVHAEMGGDTIAFLLLVPRYAKFSPEGQDSINQEAWKAIQSAISSRPGRVAVAMRSGPLLRESDGWRSRG